MSERDVTNVVPLPLRVRTPKFRFNGEAQARAYGIRRKVKLVHGGLGSGKSVLHFLRYIEQSGGGGTEQIHGLFTHTGTQLTSGILPNMEKRLKRCGVKLEYNHEPPLEWFRAWERARIPFPSLQKYGGVITLSTAVHIQHGTFHNQSFRQFHSVDFRTLSIDEFFDASEQAIRDLIPRCRCGDAEDDWDDDDDNDVLGGIDEDLEADPDCGHLHEVELYGNPPLGKHWVYDWLDRREEAAKKYHDGSTVDHRNWDLLRRGVGKMVMIRVPTRDNIRNVGKSYLEELEAGFSNDVALRYIDGEILREAAGRAFTEYSTTYNVVDEIPYDPTRHLYVWLDFDLAPRAAVFVHLLEKGEYPDQGEKDKGVIHFGVFGEFFHEADMSDSDFAKALVNGDRGLGGDCTYDNLAERGLPENWRGLRGHLGPLTLSGDAKGKDRSRFNASLSSDWAIVRQVLNDEIGEGAFSIDVPKSNPAASVRIHTTNSKFGTKGGVRATFIAARCKHLRRDAEVCEWDEAGSDLRHCGKGFGGTLWMRTHLICALGYGECRISPMGVDPDNASEMDYYANDADRPASFKVPWT